MITTKKLNNLNLLDLSYWSQGSGAVKGFPLNGGDAESVRSYDIGPYGKSVLVWGTFPNGGNDADGGWNGDFVSIDRTKTYRFSVWMRRTSSSTAGTFYMGLNTNGSGDTLRNQYNDSTTNPYWETRNIGWFSQYQWYLVVGHIFPAGTPTSGSISAHPDSGIWTRDGGRVSSLWGNSPYDVVFPADTTLARHRTYHYYSSDTAARLQFYSPRIEEITTNSPTVDNLLTTDLTDPTSYCEAIGFNDNTNQSSSSNKSTSDSGSLISVSSYTSSGTYTWMRPVNCSRVLVRVVGGGGGAAGYCESGGSGGFSERLLSVENLSSVTVTVGGGGGSVGYYAAAGDGGTSSFGSYLSASGGYGANRNISHTGGYAGSGSNGDLNLTGNTGTGHSNSHSSGATARGGSSYLGGADACNRANGGGNVGSSGAPGTGGAGARTDANYGGGAGRAGAVIIWEYE